MTTSVNSGVEPEKTKRGAGPAKKAAKAPKAKTAPKSNGNGKVDPAAAQAALDATKAKEAAEKKVAVEKDKAKKLEVAKKAAEKAAAALPVLAKEIIYRLDSAETADKKSDDHRLSAAIQLAKAEEQCKLAGIKFNEWFESNVPDRKYDTVMRLVKIGKAEDPKQALADMRLKNKGANRAYQQKKRGTNTNNMRSDKPTVTPKLAMDKAIDTVLALDDKARNYVTEKMASQAGFVLMPKEKAAEAKAKGSKVDQIMTAYENLSADEKGDFFERLEKSTGYKLTN